MKKILLITMVGLSIVFATGCGCDKKEEEKDNKTESTESLNTNKGVVKAQTVDGITFKDAILLLDGKGSSSFKVTVVYECGRTRNIVDFKVSFIGKEGNVLLETYGYIGTSLDNNESSETMISLDQDMKDAVEIKYEF